MPGSNGKGKSIVMTPDPYHTPGYGGFCPQFKYQIGQTFGRTTSRLLQDTDVASSGRLVLADIEPSASLDLGQQRRANILNSRVQSWGDQKLVEKMVPGYTGFIPKGQHYFGTRYAEGCRNSICDFELDRRTYKGKMQELTDLEALQTGRTPRTQRDLPPLKTKQVHPLKSIAAQPEPYQSPNVVKHMLSPFEMNNADPNKNFMSGYTGFVPRSRGLIGIGYPIITHHALNDFTDDVARSQSIKGLPITIHRKEKIVPDMNGVYPVETGLVPHYTGHIPGQKFRYGKTFGHSTENAMKHPLTART
ncbi:ciliary microtubule inner protein 2B-like [Haliotis cracherodii]|uniref:ciliary microtubule inner protein 2B-like n=1 Tax=Haliotis cracherodii TaxID=6455 RepID=UPI0039EC1211